MLRREPHRHGAKLAPTLMLLMFVAVGKAEGGVGPSALPEAYWWRASPVRTLAGDPLEASAGPRGVSSSVEWAPIYDGPHGSRVRQGAATTRVLTDRGSWRFGVEVTEANAIGAGGESEWNARLAVPSAVNAAFGAARAGSRAACGAAASVREGRLGGAVSLRARAAPGVQGSVGWSRLPSAGTLFARWDDDGISGVVDATGRWTDEQARGEASWTLPAAITASVRIETLHRTPANDARTERLERSLRWSATGVSLRGRSRAGGWSVDYSDGYGRERLGVLRGGSPYVRAGGSMAARDLTVEWRPAAIPVQARAWSSAWSEEARGNVAMWPFDPYLGLAGTQRVANGTASLTHRGIRIDRDAPGLRLFDGGLSVWRVEPRARYTTWRTLFFGIGREDETSGGSRVRAMTLLGLRAALRIRAGGTTIRLEGVQWLPISVEKEPGGGGAGGSGGPDGASPPEGGGNSIGGSIVRVSLTSG